MLSIIVIFVLLGSSFGATSTSSSTQILTTQSQPISSSSSVITTHPKWPDYISGYDCQVATSVCSQTRTESGLAYTVFTWQIDGAKTCMQCESTLAAVALEITDTSTTMAASSSSNGEVSATAIETDTSTATSSPYTISSFGSTGATLSVLDVGTTSIDFGTGGLGSFKPAIADSSTTVPTSIGGVFHIPSMASGSGGVSILPYTEASVALISITAIFPVTQTSPALQAAATETTSKLPQSIAVASYESYLSRFVASVAMNNVPTQTIEKALLSKISIWTISAPPTSQISTTKTQ